MRLVWAGLLVSALATSHVLAGEQAGISFERGSGTTVTNPLIIPQAGAGITTMATADLNQDGYVDIIYGLMVDRVDARVPVRILLGNGGGTFRDGTTEITSGNTPRMNFPRQIVAADFNGDGRPDLFIAGTGYDHDPWPGEPNVLLLSTTDGRLVDASDRLPRENAFSHSAAVADINGSGAPSIYVGGYWSGKNTVAPYLLVNDGRGNFRRCGTDCLPEDIAGGLRVGSAYVGAAFADVNGDGFPDLVLGPDIDATTRVLLNDGRGRFVDAPIQPPKGLFATSDTTSVAILPVDLDGDGRIDLVLSQTRAGYKGRGIQVLMGNGDGTFRDESVARLGSSAVDPNGNWTQFFRAVDVNGDGLVDLFAEGVFGGSGTAPFIWLNDGRGYFAPITSTVADGIPIYFSGIGKTRPGALPDLFMTFTDAQGNPGYQIFQNTSPIKPASGWWWNPQEGGRGYALEVRGSAIFFTAFMYEGNEARWYVATGPISAGVFEAELQRYGGPGTSFWGGTTGVGLVGSPGRIRIAFSSTSAGVMTWPGGTTEIQRFDFTTNGVRRGPAAGMPESGWYVDPTQMGKGWYIEFQGREAFVGFFSYAEGRPVWLVAHATVTGALASMLQAPLSLYCCGKTFSGGGATGLYAGSAGQMTLTFRDSTHGVARLPDGSTINLNRFKF
jgi:hypothetical protein